METLDCLKLRQSCRAYTDDQIPDSALQTLLLAARQAPIARGIYDSVHLTVVQDLRWVDRFTQRIRQVTGDVQADPLYSVPTLLVISVDEDTLGPDGMGKSNAGTIAENVMLAATELGLGSVYLHGWLRVLRNEHELFRELGVPQGFRPIAGVGLGYPQTPVSEWQPKHHEMIIHYVR
ncbi:MAG: nitroreductase family protein [Clostridia bacterium]|nr:nitroreductase family protein [Clostridia bacterium]